MHYYKCKIQYDGTSYAGFQWQTGLETVQNDINNTLTKILPGKVSTVAASRTDTGVHALDQTLKITCEKIIEECSFLELFNKNLPDQIRCKSIQECDGLFRPSAEARSKEYRYFFTNKKKINPEEHRFIANISNELNIEKMQMCIQALLGEHNFCNFYSHGSNVKSTIRHITACELNLTNPQDIFSDGDLFQIPSSLICCYQIRIEAKGFLKQMIRHIVSALWMVGSEKITVEEFINLLNSPKSEKQLWKVAPSNGLFLYKVNF